MQTFREKNLHISNALIIHSHTAHERMIEWEKDIKTTTTSTTQERKNTDIHTEAIKGERAAKVLQGKAMAPFN